MKEAMWSVDRSGKFAFSDYTYSLGPMLIEPSLDYSVLQRQTRTGLTEIVASELRVSRNSC
jgi:hypothetical protein